MNILTKTYHYIKWMIDELFSNDNPMDVYNKIAKNGVYDKVIDYEKRVLQFKKALAHMQHGLFQRVKKNSLLKMQQTGLRKKVIYLLLIWIHHKEN